jgi:hypothetical protein
VGLNILAEEFVVGVDEFGFPSRHVASLRFEIEVKAVYERVTERTRLTSGDPLSGGFAVGSEQEFCEPFGDILVRQVIVCWCATTQGEHNLLAPPVASINGFFYATAAVEKFACVLVNRVHVCSATAGIGMVASWVRASYLGERVDDFWIRTISVAS